jgi:hypothetical protein
MTNEARPDVARSREELQRVRPGQVVGRNQAMSSLRLNQADYHFPKQRRRGRTGWPLAEAKGSAGIPEADRRAIQSAIAEWDRTKKPRRRRTK